MKNNANLKGGFFTKLEGNDLCIVKHVVGSKTVYIKVVAMLFLCVDAQELQLWNRFEALMHK